MKYCFTMEITYDDSDPETEGTVCFEITPKKGDKIVSKRYDGKFFAYEVRGTHEGTLHVHYIESPEKYEGFRADHNFMDVTEYMLIRGETGLATIGDLAKAEMSKFEESGEAMRCEACMTYQADVTRRNPRCRQCLADLREENRRSREC